MQPRAWGRPRIASAVPLLVPLVDGPDRPVAVEAIRSLGRLGDPAGAPPLLKLIGTPKADAQLRLEAVTAIGGIKGDGVIDLLLDVLGDPSPPVRAAAIRSLAQLDQENFVTVLSGLDPDAHWSVRSALASVLGHAAGGDRAAAAPGDA